MNAPSDPDLKEALNVLAQAAVLDDLIPWFVANPQWLDVSHAGRLEVAAHTCDNPTGVLPACRLVAEFSHGLAVARRVSNLDELVHEANGASQITAGAFCRVVESLVKHETLPAEEFARYVAAFDELAERCTTAVAIVQERRPLAIDGQTKAALAPITLRHFEQLLDEHVRHSRAAEAENLARILEALEFLSYNYRQITDNSIQGPRPIRTLLSGQTEFWFIRVLPTAVLRPEVQAMASGVRTLPEGLRRVQRQALRLLATAEADESSGLVSQRPSRESMLFSSTAAACVLVSLLADGPYLQAEALAAYHQLFFNSAWWDKLMSAERSDAIMRYTKVLFGNLGVLHEPRAQLEELATWLRHALRELAPGTSPGLTRDLGLALGRTLRELSRWRPDLLESAIAAFRAALDVPYARHDAQARGAGLSDFCGALRALPATQRPSDFELKHFFNLALAHLPADRFATSRAVVLVNFAIFYNERPDGVEAHNQERALALCDEAFPLTQPQPRHERGEDDFAVGPILRELQATVLLTRGNVLRARAFGDPSVGASQLVASLHPGNSPRVAAAILAYRDGLRALGDGGHLYLRGLLQLNAGQALLEDGAEDVVAAAIQYLRLAVEHLDGAPAMRAQALVSQSEAWLRVAVFPRDRAAALQKVKELSQVENDLVAHGLPHRVGFLAEQQARLQLAAKPDDRSALDFACGRMSYAASRFAEAGLDRLVVEACWTHARLLVRWRGEADGEVHRNDLLRAAGESLRRAQGLLLAMSRGTLPLQELFATEAQIGAITADLVYLEELSGANPQVIRPLLSVASALGVEEQSHDYEANARRRALMAERDLRLAHASASVEQHVDVQIGELERALEVLQRGTRERAGGPGESHASADPQADDRIILEFAVSEWGTVVGITDARTSEFRTVLVPLQRKEVLQWLYGSDDAVGWRVVNLRRRSEAEKARWSQELRRLLADIAARIWLPLREQDVVLRGRRVTAVPGVLATLPLSSAIWENGPLIAEVSGFSLALSTARTLAIKPRCAVLVIADSAQAEEDMLVGAAPEVAAVASVLAGQGAAVTVFASQGSATGRDVFARAGVVLPPETAVAETRLTREVLATSLAGADLFLFAGHGVGTSELGGALGLVPSDGRSESFSVFDALSSLHVPEGAQILLSACESAWEADAPFSGMASITTAFARLGAGIVLGSLWYATDAYSPRMSKEFVSRVLDGASFDVAFVDAVRGLMASGAEVRHWGTYTLWAGIPQSGSAVADVDQVTRTRLPAP